MTPLIIDSRVILFRNILTSGHSVRVRVRVSGSIYFGESKYFVTPATVLSRTEERTDITTGLNNASFAGGGV